MNHSISLKNKIESMFLNHWFLNNQAEKEAKLIGAAYSGNLLLYQKVWKICGIKPAWETLKGAICSGNFLLFFQVYNDCKLTFDNILLEKAAASNNFEIFRYALERYHQPIDRSICTAAVGNLDIFHLAYSKSKLPIDKKTLCNSARSGSIDIFNSVLAKSHLPIDINILSSAAASGNLELYDKVLKLYGGKPDKNVLFNAIISRNSEMFLHVLKEVPNRVEPSWLHLITYFIENKNTHLIAIENLDEESVIDENVLKDLARAGKKEIFALALAQTALNVQVDSGFLCEAAKSGNPEIFSLALQRKAANVFVDYSVIEAAAESGNPIFFQQLLQEYKIKFESNSGPYGLIRSAARGGNSEICAFALNFSNSCSREILIDAAEANDPSIFPMFYNISDIDPNPCLGIYYKTLGENLKKLG
jgi:hypothetical protein